jgi:hypothetical protein
MIQAMPADVQVCSHHELGPAQAAWEAQASTHCEFHPHCPFVDNGTYPRALGDTGYEGMSWIPGGYCHLTRG